ncbi:hypothetical protein U9M48_017177 [Paspalum notatum var. saurae]|uniref:DUF6598 domain-containing protein n=1 Tax=Paspalum notatum var. saurae TaxID=547442 RepID=A0AAQ3TAE2_PASNO
MSRATCKETIVPPMRYTFHIPEDAISEQLLQIFSVHVSSLNEGEGLHWPLHVYGLIAARDCLDPRRNYLFQRSRENCQTITKELKAKDETESEDKVLAFDVLTSQHGGSYWGRPPPIVTSFLLGKRIELGFTFALLSASVEATISVEVLARSEDGSMPEWPEDIRGIISAHTASLPQGNVLLLDSKDGQMLINDSGVIMLSRKVVCVELSGKLRVQFDVFYPDGLKSTLSPNASLKIKCAIKCATVLYRRQREG